MLCWIFGFFVVISLSYTTLHEDPLENRTSYHHLTWIILAEGSIFWGYSIVLFFPIYFLPFSCLTLPFLGQEHNPLHILPFFFQIYYLLYRVFTRPSGLLYLLYFKYFCFFISSYLPCDNKISQKRPLTQWNITH